VLHVADKRLVRLIALGKKITHRFPAQFKLGSDEVTHPKIAEGKVHKVYNVAPFGSDGDPEAQPLLTIMIERVELSPLGDITEEEARLEGFASLETFIGYWNRVWFNRALKFENNRYHPVWVISFQLLEILPDGETLLEELERDLRKKRKM